MEYFSLQVEIELDLGFREGKHAGVNSHKGGR